MGFGEEYARTAFNASLNSSPGRGGESKVRGIARRRKTSEVTEGADGYLCGSSGCPTSICPARTRV
jgi:hypothetical protein